MLSFISPRVVTVPSYKNPVYLTIYPLLGADQIDSCLSQRHEVKHKQPCSGFQHRLLITFPMIVTITLSMPPLQPWYSNCSRRKKTLNLNQLLTRREIGLCRLFLFKTHHMNIATMTKSSYRNQ